MLEPWEAVLNHFWTGDPYPDEPRVVLMAKRIVELQQKHEEALDIAENYIRRLHKAEKALKAACDKKT